MSAARKKVAKKRKRGRPMLVRRPARLTIVVDERTLERLLARYPGLSASAAGRAALEELLEGPRPRQ